MICQPSVIFCRWEKTFWLFFLILESSHFSHLAMKCTGFFLVYSYLSQRTSYYLAQFTAVWCRFSPIQHVQLSSPGNSRTQLGRMLTVDSRQVFILVPINHVFIIYMILSMTLDTTFRIMVTCCFLMYILACAEVLTTGFSRKSNSFECPCF